LNVDKVLNIFSTLGSSRGNSSFAEAKPEAAEEEEEEKVCTPQVSSSLKLRRRRTRC
jgi:hypothetical protein